MFELESMNYRGLKDYNKMTKISNRHQNVYFFENHVIKRSRNFTLIDDLQFYSREHVFLISPNKMKCRPLQLQDTIEISLQTHTLWILQTPNTGQFFIWTQKTQQTSNPINLNLQVVFEKILQDARLKIYPLLMLYVIYQST